MRKITFNKLCVKLMESPVMQEFEKMKPGITVEAIDLLKEKVVEDVDD